MQDIAANYVKSAGQWPTQKSCKKVLRIQK